jgi:hypothetical protein
MALPEEIARDIQQAEEAEAAEAAAEVEAAVKAEETRDDDDAESNEPATDENEFGDLDLSTFGMLELEDEDDGDGDGSGDSGAKKEFKQANKAWTREASVYDGESAFKDFMGSHFEDEDEDDSEDYEEDSEDDAASAAAAAAAAEVFAGDEGASRFTGFRRKASVYDGFSDGGV